MALTKNVKPIRSRRGAVGWAQEALAEAESKAEATADGPDPDDLALANARLDQAKSQQVAAEKALTEAELKAPMAGKLVQLDLTVGGKTTLGLWSQS